MAKLVVVESPSKAKTISKYLGKDYVVMASKGHVVDLPKSKMGIDVEAGFKPSYEVTNRKALSALKKAYAEADGLVLAVDLDREGEAIGWHVAQKLGAIDGKGKIKKGHDVERIVFSEITKDAIQKAVQNPRDINMNLVNAQQARRFLDRLVGYNLSPVLWKKIAFGLSAGRVQSVALRLVVEREEERDAFRPEEYWSLDLFGTGEEGKTISKIAMSDEITSDVRKELEHKVKAFVLFSLTKINGKKAKFDQKKDVEKVIENLEESFIRVDSVNEKITKKYPKPPFITSTLQQAAINQLGFSSKKTMSVAQKLYEKGFITYMRTDSVSISNEALNEIRAFINKNYGSKYLPEKANIYKSKSKSSQEAHECIRPVNVNIKTDKTLTPDEQKLYDLILNRTLASQMVPAEIKQVSVIAKKDRYEFKATGSTIVFDGYLATGVEKLKEQILPEIKKDQKFFAGAVLGVQHFTQPPARYSEATLIKKLEDLEIGRPSTYSSIISTISNRRYVVKDGKYLVPTDTGKVVIKLLKKYFTNIVDYDFTSELEEDLDEIAEGKLEWKKMLNDFYRPFEKAVKENTEKIPREEFTVIGEAPEGVKCPECGGNMNKKLGKDGPFYSCTRWPDCKGMRGIDGDTKEEIESEAESEEFKSIYEPAPKTDEGKPYILKKGRYGKFWAHPDYPKVKDAKPLVLRPEKIVEVYGEIPKTKDGRDFVLRKGRFGEFWAHPDYPKVKEVRKIQSKEK
ncbi:MAG: type I DNA topoisomerase [Candidatus Dojkabacteria bacterium]